MGISSLPFLNKFSLSGTGDSSFRRTNGDCGNGDARLPVCLSRGVDGEPVISVSAISDIESPNENGVVMKLASAAGSNRTRLSFRS